MIRILTPIDEKIDRAVQIIKDRYQQSATAQENTISITTPTFTNGSNTVNKLLAYTS